VTSSAQINYALRVLRCHGLSNAALQLVYRTTVVTRLTYAVSAWHGLTRTSHRQSINSVIDRAKRLGYCSPDLTTLDELRDIADDVLFGKVVQWSIYVLHTLLPPLSTASQSYSFKHRAHTRLLPEHSTHLSDCNFLTRMLYKSTYYVFYFIIHEHSFIHSTHVLISHFLCQFAFYCIFSICYNCVLSIVLRKIYLSIWTLFNFSW